MHARRVCVALGAGVLALLAVACGGGSDEGTGGAAGTARPAQATTASQSAAATATTGPQGAGVALDPCTLLTKAEVEAATGVTVRDPERSGQPPNALCGWGDSRTLTRDAVQVLLNAGGNATNARRIYDASKSPSSQDLTGLGDAAQWDSLTNSLVVLKGAFVVSFDVGQSTTRDRMTVARELAAKGAVRVP